MSAILQRAVLVVGGAGYIGSHAAYQAHRAGYRVIILDLFRYQNQKKYQNFSPKWATVIRGDYGDKLLLYEIFSSYLIDAVFHFASRIEVGISLKEPAEFYDNNLAKTLVLLDAMRSFGIKKLIFSSSCAVYGNPEQTPISEDSPFNPVSPYGKTKVCIEYILQDYSRAYNLKYVSLRYFNASGGLPELNLGEFHEPETHIIPLVLRGLYTNKPFTIFGSDYNTPDGTAIRDYIHVLDIARAHILALDYLDKTGVSETFNLGTGMGSSVREVITAAEELTRKKLDIILGERREGDPPRLVASYQKAQDILKWKPVCSRLPFILASALTWELQHNFFELASNEV